MKVKATRAEMKVIQIQFLLFLLVQQCHINKKMWKGFQRKYLMEERRKPDETGQDVTRTMSMNFRTIHC